MRFHSEQVAEGEDDKGEIGDFDPRANDLPIKTSHGMQVRF